ncbi:MAG: peptidoglycan DD-metalloendopeptidase family protein [Lachnospiraceae bacterium]|nr:peptidoglycan DD-metalloendopeptidase family protein [Lachnospiraceae bacterium]
MNNETNNNQTKTEDTLFELLELVAPDPDKRPDGAVSRVSGAASPAAAGNAGGADDGSPDDDYEEDDGSYDFDGDDDDYDEDGEDDEDDADTEDDLPDDDADELPIINGKRVERRKKPRVKKDPEFDLTHPDYTLTLTKGLTNEVVRRRYYPHNRAIATFLLSFLVFLAAVCFMVYSVIYIIGNERLKRSQQAQIERLTEEVESLKAKNGELSSTVTHLSRSVNRTLEDHRVEAQAFEQALVPKGFPLSVFVPMEIILTGENNVFGDMLADTGEENDSAGAEDTAGESDSAGAEDTAGESDSADTEDAAGESDSAGTEDTAGESDPAGKADVQIPTAVFEAQEGSSVLAAGGGVVTRITADGTGGLVLTIDHRNGYVTSYHNAGTALVNVGDSVWRGDELFQIGEENTLFAFRVRMNDTWLDPEEIIELGG